LAITRAGRGGSKVAVIDSIIGGIRPMRTGIFAFLKSKKQAVNDADFSFGKTVLEAVKNSKGTTEEELAGEMKGVLDSMAILKDCEAKTKLTDVVKDCFDNKEMAVSNEEELTKTLDSMWFEIHGDSLSEIAKAFDKLKKPANTDTAVKDSEEESKEDENKDSEEESKEDENKDSEDKEEKNEDSEDKEDKEEKDGCNKDSVADTKDTMVTAILDSLKAELKPLVAEAVKDCLGIKDSKTSVEGSELDSKEDFPVRDYSDFLE